MNRTRTEVVVVLFILILLGGLVLGGVAKMREAANRMRCSNNLKQLAIGAHNYYDTMQRLPPLTDQGVGAPMGNGLTSVFWNLTPYLEATPILYRAGQSPAASYHAPSSVPFPFQNKDGTQGTQFGGVANQVWQTFIDPADATADRLRDVPMTLPDGTTGYYATGSYAANGLLPWGMKGGPKSLLEWSPDIILFAERPQVCRTATGEIIYNLWGVGFYSPHMPAFAALTPTDPPGLWATGQIAAATDSPHPIQSLSKNTSCDPRLPGSPHRGGMQTAMNDGSVRMFAPDTDPRVFWAACTPFGKPGDPANDR